MLEKSIREFKRLTYTEGVRSGLRFWCSSADAYVFSRLAQCLVYHRMNGYVLKKLNNSGVRMILNAADEGISQELMLKGSHEPLSTKILMENLREGMHVVEVGANLGYFALQEAKAIGPEGVVYAIEPVPENYFLLKHNVALNNLDNVQVFNLAVSGENGFLDLFLGRASNWASAIKTDLNISRKITVPAQSLDTFLEDKGRVDLVRMDVEGYETRIVEGMTETLKQKDLMLFMEIHPIFTDEREHLKLLERLDEAGFEPFAVVVGNHPGKLVKNVTSMESLIRNRYLRSTIFHGFFRN
ncbi:MAG: FkbM family methyltransferase [Candidatus Bathyarchaeota archaeon]|nr:FkbM family methyltransferase [Candidatus Bathyarchaeota archaeon]